MCGRVHVNSSLQGMLNAFAFANGEQVGSMANSFPRYNGGPGLDYPIIIRNPFEEPGASPHVFVHAKWGLVPRWAKDAGRPPPINAKCETIKTNGYFRESYRYRRCIMPITGYFEWKDIYGTGKNKQPYAFAMADSSPFALAGIWDDRRDPATGLSVRTFAVVTCEPNSMMAQIHDRMPLILHRNDYERWMSSEEDPSDLMVPFPSELMKMWPIGRQVGNVRNNTPDILDEVEPDLGPEPDLF